MRLLIPFLLTVFAAPALAEIEVLPGTTPQTAVVGQVLPKPVRFRVTDQGVPVEQAVVSFSTFSYSYPNRGLFSLVEECHHFDMNMVCSAVTGADGIAEFIGLSSDEAAAYRVQVVAVDWAHERVLGSTEASFTFTPGSPPYTLSFVSGEGQSVPRGSIVPGAIGVKLSTSTGAPVSGMRIEFLPRSSASERFGFEGADAAKLTDASGIAVASALQAGWGRLTRTMKVRAVNALGNTLAVASTSLQIVDQFEGVDDRVTSMWWGGLSQNGWGMSAVQHYAQLFNVLFVYDQDGAPTWYAQPRGKWLTGLGSTFWGPIYSPRSAPWHSYNSAAFVPGEPAGTLTLDFLGPGRARLSAKIGSQLTEKELAPQDFSEGTFDFGSHLSDMWWGGSEQNGWGIAVFSQLESLFLVWFTYDDAGKPVWFVMPAGRWGQLGGFSGPIYRTKGAPWSGLTYDPSRLEIVSVGSFSLVPLPGDPDGDRHRFNYRFEGREGHLDLTRQPFD